jgi:hypothetical protein
LNSTEDWRTSFTANVAPVILAGLGEGELATARGRCLPEMSKSAHATWRSVPPLVMDQLWSFVSCAIGLGPPREVEGHAEIG